MDFVDLELEIIELDEIYRPVATMTPSPEELMDFASMGTRVEAALAKLGVEHRAEAAVRALIVAYEQGDESARAEIRGMLQENRSFQWAAHLPPEWNTAEEFRARLIHLSARDQGFDLRDELLSLWALCDRAREYEIDVDPILEEVAAMSSDVDRDDMGSMRDAILRYASGDRA